MIIDSFIPLGDFGVTMEDKELEEALAASIDESFNKSELDDIMNEIENLEKEFSEDSNGPSASDSDASLALEKANNNSLQEEIDKEVQNFVEEVKEQPVAETSEPVAETTEPVAEAPKEFSQDLIDQAFKDAAPKSETAETTEMTSEQFDDTPVEEPVMEEMDDSDDEEVAFTEEELADVTSGLDDEYETDNVVPMGQSTDVSSSHSSYESASQVDFQASGSMDLSVNLNIAGQNAHMKVENGSLTVHLNGVNVTISEEEGCSIKMAGGVNFSVPLNVGEASKKAS